MVTLLIRRDPLERLRSHIVALGSRNFADMCLKAGAPDGRVERIRFRVWQQENSRMLGEGRECPR